MEQRICAAKKSDYAFLKLDTIQSAILLGICRPEENLLGEVLVFPDSGILLKSKRRKGRFFFSSQALIYFRFVSVL